MTIAAVHQMVERVSNLLTEKHRLGGRSLAAKLKRGRRLLPRKLRAAADRLAAVETEAQNPRFRARIDLAQVTRDYDACVSHLAAIDVGKRRRGRVMSMVESVGIGILFFGLSAAALYLWFLA